MPHSLHTGDPTRIGPYRLHARLGGGGMGQVYLGRSPGGRLVAIKVVRPELADDAHFRHRFAAEIDAARKVGGFYTAPVVDADPHGTPPWLATAYIPGPSLHQAVTDHGPLPVASVAVLGAGLAEGLAAVHDCGLVHRDLKPGNVILAEDGPRLIDFGIARALDATSHTHSAAVLGTAAFMSPEQARAEAVGTGSDVFSLGCVLAFAATGRSPFGHGPAHAVAYRVVHADPDLSGVPDALSGLVAACLAKDPAARPDLARILDHLTALTAAGDAPADARWLPETLTEVIAQRRTLALTAVQAPAGERHPGGGGGGDADAGSDGRGDGGRPAPAPPQGPHPAAPPHGTHPPLLANERRLARGRPPLYPASGYQIAVYVALTLFTLCSAVTVVAQLLLLDHVLGLDPNDGYYDLGDGYLSLLTVHALSGAGVIACWLAWFARARGVAERIAPGRLRYSPAMAVYGWFIPAANLYLPKQIANDVWHASSPPGHGGAMAPAGILHAWWVMWLITFAGWPLFWWPWTEFLPYYGPDPWFWGNMALQVLVLPAAIVTALYVRRLSAMQAARLTG
ncbi:protein kinase [Streptomonospora sp. S1-112]|uniref:Protein kinase n=1 Tax=Streptomonospora mangrovi TaxID=2883123 RepID=A0A9X3NL40_9ACTN|nr:protein kinase [Streptomonospora mangrovi]MDA0564046.1 protein kinase [Streptomonospora mangrovi]